jgi:tRNA-dihydrouridine synthase B
MSKIKIGDFELDHGLFLAPLAGVSDRAFRDVCRRHGAEYTVSEMVSAKALCYEQATKRLDKVKTAPLASVFKYEMPMAIQLFGSEPEFMARAAKLIEDRAYVGCESDTKPAAIDINMGCPVHKVVGNGEGSALMRNPRLAADIVRAVVGAVNLPVTVKIRAGWDENSINAPEMAKMLEDAGASLIAVHGRTRSQMYAPSSDNGVIAAVKKSVSVPVVGNGDIYSADDAVRMLEETECDGVMIARGALGNPWIFEEIAARLEGREYLPPTVEERLGVALCQIEQMIKEKGEYVAIAESRKHLSWYTKGMSGATKARCEINSAKTFDEMKEIISKLY